MIKWTEILSTNANALNELADKLEGASLSSGRLSAP